MLYLAVRSNSVYEILYMKSEGSPHKHDRIERGMVLKGKIELFVGDPEDLTQETIGASERFDITSNQIHWMKPNTDFAIFIIWYE